MPTIALRGSALEEALRHKGAETNVARAKVLGVNDGTVSRVFAGIAAPGPRFIAATLSALPVRFDDVFSVVQSD